VTSSEIRTLFVRYFSDHGHKPMPSTSLIPQDDPTLLFTNAGMVPFKKIFLGEAAPLAPRIVSSQKCIRAGGKHNDLENVGQTARHHTFFEMLGNFSFGDYFKEEAIHFAWELLTERFRLPPDRLWITIFEADDEAARLWKRIVPAERILRLGKKDNFWQMGDVGPCGPCSEIMFDQGEALHADCPGIGHCDCDRYLEIWNLVFMQFSRDASGRMSPLPKPSIDTGMGLERMAAVCQGVLSNYETDLFQPLFQAISDLSGRPLEAVSTSMPGKVIADHVRAMTFLVCDGLLPSNEGRGYLFRRILRRAARFGRQLGFESPFLHHLTETLVDQMGSAYPELHRARHQVERIVLGEEERFIRTLDKGLGLLEEIMTRVRKRSGQQIPGADLFSLYDTYGFPVDLAEEVASEAGLSLDLEGFNAAMSAQKTRARRSWVGGARSAKASEDKAFFRKLADRLGETSFVGYDGLKEKVRLQAILKGNDSVKSAEAGEEVLLVFQPSPFYAESGGQVGDQGRLFSGNTQATVVRTEKPLPGLHLHCTKVVQGRLKVGSCYEAEVDAPSRAATARNHTATHLLHAVLREVLGDHVKQAGSLVAPDRLRFDFQHFAALSSRELNRIEATVNARIIQDKAVETRTMPMDAAIESGAMALFGEKYGQEVRVVSVEGFSRELCGGTHCQRIGEIGLFKITKEGSVAAGVRRIEAVTGLEAYRWLKAQEKTLHEVAALLRSQPEDLLNQSRKLLQQVQAKEREIERLRSRREGGASNPLSKVRKIGALSLLVDQIEGADIKVLRAHADHLRDLLQSGIIVVGAAAPEGEKVSIVVMVTSEWAGQYPASKLANALALLVGGKGGGRAEMAQAGGKGRAKLSEALEASAGFVKQMAQGKPPG